MLRSVVVLTFACLLASCVSRPTVLTRLFQPKPDSAQQALAYYYDTIDAADLPVAPAGAPLPGEDAVLTTILVGSCLDEEKPLTSEALMQIAATPADLFLMVGDNVYGDMDGRSYVNNDAELTELREAFQDLSERADFQAVRAAVPMMVAWDDHDYGANDMGMDFAFQGLAERIHERFWGLDSQDVGHWPGTYYARSFGPEGQRVQIIVLDTRFFRSALTPTDAWGQPGKERYLPAPAGSMQDMLGAVQWTWLENQLRQPADLRLIVSSVQVLPTVHGWEAWGALPDERSRLFELIDRTAAKGVVFVSGDRHTAFLYEDDSVLSDRVVELTASSLNLSFSDETSERDARQIGAGFSPENFGALTIDWQARTIDLEIRDTSGEAVRQHRVAFEALGVG